MFHHFPSLATFVRTWRNKVGALVLLLLVLFLGVGTVSSHPYVIPTISITSVQQGQSVTFQTYNYPAGQTFTVRMGKMGTRGIGGIVVGSLDSGTGGSMPATFTIPAELKDEYQIAIRLDSNLGFYSYNWFYNNTTNPASKPGTSEPFYIGIPTFKITAVTEGKDVTIVTNNFPAGMTFNVTMGKMYTRGIDGIPVGTIESGTGGTLTKTFNIPPELAGDGRISIRAQTAHVNPYYAFNWFWNNSTSPTTATSTTTTSTTSTTATSTTATSQPYYGIPTFKVCQVTRDGKVEILTHNYPHNQTFNLTMGPMYTQGIGGIAVGTLESKNDSSARYWFNIPPALHGSYRISIRAQTGHTYPYIPFYSYNWFYNNTTTIDHCQ